MAERLIGSLLYDEHPKARPLKDRLKYPVIMLLVLVVIGALTYTFINYPYERRVQAFLDAIRDQRYEEAYGMWDGGEAYDMKRFLEDWGTDAYYTLGSTLEVVDSNTAGRGVIVYVSVHPDDETPTAIRVDKETRRLSYSPTNKYLRTRIYGPPE